MYREKVGAIWAVTKGSHPTWNLVTRQGLGLNIKAKNAKRKTLRTHRTGASR